MNKTFRILVSATLMAAAAAHAADTDGAAGSGLTREQVRRDLQAAIANGEIVHGDLAVFQALTATVPAAARQARKPAADGAAKTASRKDEPAAPRSAQSSGR